MKSLLNPADRAELLARLDRLGPDARKRWGRMSVGGMLCHLTDAFDVVLGDRATARKPRFHERAVLRLVALHTPVPWPRGIKTVPECAQEHGGTTPGSFEQDKAKLRATVERFVAEVDPDKSAHPIFGKLTPGEWGHWAWRHMNHHLRQFSA